MNERGDGLPPDGVTLRANRWRQQALWIVCGCMAMLTVLSAVYVFIEGQAIELLTVGVWAIFTALVARAAMAGIILEGHGVKARAAFKTHHWAWNEIERFELREQGSKPRFLVHLRDGTWHGYLGFFAWSAKEEAKSQELFKALQTRLDQEHARTASTPLSPEGSA